MHINQGNWSPDGVIYGRPIAHSLVFFLSLSLSSPHTPFPPILSTIPSFCPFLVFRPVHMKSIGQVENIALPLFSLSLLMFRSVWQLFFSKGHILKEKKKKKGISHFNEGHLDINHQK